MPLPHSIGIFTSRKGNAFSTYGADNHTLVFISATFGTLMSLVLEVLGAIGLSTSITCQWQEIFLLAVWISTMCATISKVRHSGLIIEFSFK
jgi:hypothetical protein